MVIAYQYVCFNRQLPFGGIFILFIAAILFFNAFIQYSTYWRLIIPGVMVFLVGSVALLLYYHCVGQYKYPDNALLIPYRNHQPRIQSEDAFFEIELPSDYVPEHELLNKYGRTNPDDEVRILFIGSSQTWGAGASTEENTWVSRFERDWIDTCIGKCLVMNASVSGQESGSLLKFHKYITRFLRPDICLINLSFNDRDNDTSVFRRNLEYFLSINEEDGVKTIMIPEISNPDTKNTRSEIKVALNRKVVHGVGDRYGVPIIGMQDTIWTMRDQGFLFWDDVHLTDFGQEVYAAVLLEKVREYFPTCLPYQAPQHNGQ